MSETLITSPQEMWEDIKDFNRPGIKKKSEKASVLLHALSENHDGNLSTKST
jgi:hypothetical protein